MDVDIDGQASFGTVLRGEGHSVFAPFNARVVEVKPGTAKDDTMASRVGNVEGNDLSMLSDFHSELALVE